jgi:hypothetical protein
MGARTGLLMYSDGCPIQHLKSGLVLDRNATAILVQNLFPTEKLSPIDDTDLLDSCPPDNQIVIGCFPNLTIVASKEVGLDYPSRLQQRFVQHGADRTMYLHAMHSVVDWFAFAIWERGQLKRSLSLSSGSGILEDIGKPLNFEKPYWEDQFPMHDPVVRDDHQFDFHPLDLGQSALLDLFGYQTEGKADASKLDPENISLMRFERSKPFWKIW